MSDEYEEAVKQGNEAHDQYIIESKERVVSFKDNARRTDVLEKDMLAREICNKILSETNVRLATAYESIAKSLEIIANKLK